MRRQHTNSAAGAPIGKSRLKKRNAALAPASTRSERCIVEAKISDSGIYSLLRCGWLTNLKNKAAQQTVTICCVTVFSTKILLQTATQTRIKI